MSSRAAYLPKPFTPAQVSIITERIASMRERNFDLIISDIGLPDGSGLDLMRHVQVRRPCKGIVLSGFGTEEDVRRSKEAGFAEHLTKPLKYEQLQAAIARLTLSPVSTL